MRETQVAKIELAYSPGKPKKVKLFMSQSFWVSMVLLLILLPFDSY